MNDIKISLAKRGLAKAQQKPVMLSCDTRRRIAFLVNSSPAFALMVRPAPKHQLF
jgi:hypothetical protein